MQFRQHEVRDEGQEQEDVGDGATDGIHDAGNANLEEQQKQINDVLVMKGGGQGFCDDSTKNDFSSSFGQYGNELSSQIHSHLFNTLCCILEEPTYSKLLTTTMIMD